MRGDPRLDTRRVGAALDTNHGIAVASIAFLPISLDDRAAVYRVESIDGTGYFLKAMFGRVESPGLAVSSALVERGIHNILAPIRTRSGAMSCQLDGDVDLRLVLFPFIDGTTAKAVGLTDGQWRTFGAAVRAVHDSGLESLLRDRLDVEAFELPAAAKVRSLLDIVTTARFERPAARRHAVFWREHSERITWLLDRTETLGRMLRGTPFDAVLCHGDIHAANILVARDGRILLADWDGPPEPLIAPRERDLLFVIGSRIARPVEPRETDRFLEGYGPVSIDRHALVYFRYERIVQDIGEYGESVFLSQDLDEDMRADDAAAVVAFFEPGGAIEVAETIDDRFLWVRRT